MPPRLHRGDHPLARHFKNVVLSGGVESVGFSSVIRIMIAGIRHHEVTLRRTLLKCISIADCLCTGQIESI